MLGSLVGALRFGGFSFGSTPAPGFNLVESTTTLLITSCISLGLYCLSRNNTLGVALLGTGTNLLILRVATKSHLLTQSFVLTAIVIGTGTLVTWYRHSPS